ncbi:hypothetical protein C8R44DRAFT_738585 [Mycena epipterygia]|nr:hypothetical protein C8R44DRAFT_738585 [Mycena epipterygia]
MPIPHSAIFHSSCFTADIICPTRPTSPALVFPDSGSNHITLIHVLAYFRIPAYQHGKFPSGLVQCAKVDALSTVLSTMHPGIGLAHARTYLLLLGLFPPCTMFERLSLRPPPLLAPRCPRNGGIDRFPPPWRFSIFFVRHKLLMRPWLVPQSPESPNIIICIAAVQFMYITRKFAMTTCGGNSEYNVPTLIELQDEYWRSVNAQNNFKLGAEYSTETSKFKLPSGIWNLVHNLKCKYALGDIIIEIAWPTAAVIGTRAAIERLARFGGMLQTLEVPNRSPIGHVPQADGVTSAAIVMRDSCKYSICTMRPARMCTGKPSEFSAHSLKFIITVSLS